MGQNFCQVKFINETQDVIFTKKFPKNTNINWMSKIVKKKLKTKKIEFFYQIGETTR